MKTNRTSDIARAISERYDISAREASSFLNTMVDIINEALQYEKQIKIKGLGTFKLTSVSARESIDVTTGERINIEGREKISFTPDTTLRDRVNAPFAQFETFVINDGVDFAEIDARFDALKENIEEEEGQQPVSSVSQDAQPEPTELREQPLVAALQQETAQPVAAPDPAVEEEPVATPVFFPVAEEKADESDVEETATTQESVVAEPDVENKEEKDNTPEESMNEVKTLQQLVADLREGKEEAEDSLSSIRRRLYWLVAAMLLLLLVVGGGGVYMLHQLNQRDLLIHELLAANLERAQQTEQEATQADEQSATPVGEGGDEQKTEQAAEQADEPQSESAPAVKEEKSGEAASESKYDSDPRIRLGAYRIVGIDRQVTVVRGQTFKIISKAHLGEGMECYMEAVNPGVTTVKEGDVLNIPKLELKKKQR